MATQTTRPKIGMVSLGCAKNLVDAEIMLGGAAKENFDLTREPDEADVLVINTCGFIDQAKEESIDTILEMHQRRLAARPEQKIIVSGCLAQRYHEELKAEIPEVDAFIGLDQIAEFPRIVRDVLDRPATETATPLDLVTRKSRYIPDYDTPRFQLTPRHTAYVKIAEGCNHPCSFCIIPQMRGRHRSRTIDSVVAEARQLVDQGVKELNLISQDTTYFGMDRWERKAGPRQPVDSSRGPTLCRLLEELDQIEGDFWIRLLYTHPAHWSDELITTIAQSRKVARYVDMPLQHIHEEMLQLMRRETSRQHIEDLIVNMRAGIPGLAIRTTFITGFPGETDEHFESLLEFIERIALRAPRRFQILAGRRLPRRQDGRTNPRVREKQTPRPRHEAAAKDRPRTRRSTTRPHHQSPRRTTAGRPQRTRRPRRRLPSPPRIPSPRRRVRRGHRHRRASLRPGRPAPVAAASPPPVVSSKNSRRLGDAPSRVIPMSPKLLDL